MFHVENIKEVAYGAQVNIGQNGFNKSHTRNYMKERSGNYHSD
jgi:hypothetical protein